MNQQNICVSVLVPVYNVEQYIERCARSLFEQSYDNIEYVFIDDCTPDNSISILNDVIKEYPNRKKSIRIIKHDINRGLAAARKTATLCAKTEYIFHIDSDDYLELDCIELLCNMAAKTNADMVISDFNLVYLNKKKPIITNISGSSIEVAQKFYIREYPAFIWGKLIRRKIIIDNSIFAREGLNISEDYVVIPRIAFYSNKIVKVDAVLYNYIKYNENSYTIRFDEKAIKSTIEAFKILSSFFLSKGRDNLDKHIIELSAINNSITLLSVAKRSEYDLIRSLFSDFDLFSFPIEVKYKILLFLVKYRWFRIARISIKIVKCLDF